MLLECGREGDELEAAESYNETRKIVRRRGQRKQRNAEMGELRCSKAASHTSHHTFQQYN